MTSLTIPTARTPAISPKTSAQSMRSAIRVDHENTLLPTTHSRRASQDEEHPRSRLPSMIDEAEQTSLEPSEQEDDGHVKFIQAAWSHETPAHIDRNDPALIAVDELELPHADGKLPSHHHHAHHAHLGVRPIKTIHVGKHPHIKQLEVPADLLEAKSRYFRQLFEIDPIADDLVLDEVDPIAMGMLVRWLMGGDMDKPDNFHDLTHWFGLYVLAKRFEMPELGDHCMDTIRACYRHQVQTASPFRLQFIYTYTEPSDRMRDFVISTAASRALDNGLLSSSMQQLIASGGELAVDFAQALINQARNPLNDARAGSDSDWHSNHDEISVQQSVVELQVDGK